MKSILNRRYVIDSLRRELVGPSPIGKEIDCTQPVSFSTYEDAQGPWVQKDTKEEILQRDPPTRRYGVGVLHPLAPHEALDEPDLAVPGFISRVDSEQVEPNPLLKDSAVQDLERGLRHVEQAGHDDALNDLDLSGSNAYRPSSMGISFLVEIPPGSKLVVNAFGGRYDSLTVNVCGSSWTWWLRRPVIIQEEFEALSLITQNPLCQNG